MEEQINKIKETFAVWETKLGIPKEQLFQEFEHNMKSLEKNYSGPTLLARAIQIMRGAYSKQFNNKAKAFECVVIGLGQVYDRYKKVRQDAVDKGFLNENGQPIFTDYKWREGKIIPPANSTESMQSRVYGLFKENTQGQWKPGVMFYDGNPLDSKLLFAKTQVRGGIKDEALADPVLTINSTNVTRFIKTEDAKDVEEMFKQLMPQNCIALENTEQANSDALPLNIVITKGTVVNVNITDGDKSNIVELAKPINDLNDIDLSAVGPEETPNYTIWMPKQIDLTKVGIGSEVLVVTQISKITDKDNNLKTNYNGIGLYVLNGVVPEIQDIPAPAEEQTKIDIVTPKTEEPKTEAPSAPVEEQGSDVPW